MNRITKISSISAEYKDRFKTYEGALSVGLDKAINILENTL